MRVTKLIKNYIERRVDAIYQPKIEEVRADYNAQYDRLTKILDDLLDKVNQDAKNVLKDSGFIGGYGYNDNEEIFYRRDIHNNSWLDEIRKKENVIKKERNEKIEEIIITLELGGTKAQLEEMLNALV